MSRRASSSEMGTPRLGEHLLQNADRREAAVIDRRSRPIENDGLHRSRTISSTLRRRHYMFISRIICSARPNDSVMPEPPTAVTMRTPGAASIATQDLSGCFAYTPYHRCAIDRSGATRNVAHVLQHEFVDFSFVEDIDGETILVRIAQRQRAVRGLRDQRVNGEAIIVGQFARDPLLIFRQRRRADFKCGIEAQRETRGEGRAKLPAMTFCGAVRIICSLHRSIALAANNSG